MWPSMFGPGWQWGVLVALSLGCLLIGLWGFVALVVRKPRPEAATPFDQLWRRHEEGDITVEEFDRLRRKIPLACEARSRLNRVMEKLGRSRAREEFGACGKIG